jgi:hypothetical protein
LLFNYSFSIADLDHNLLTLDFRVSWIISSIRGVPSKVIGQNKAIPTKSDVQSESSPPTPKVNSSSSMQARLVQKSQEAESSTAKTITLHASEKSWRRQDAKLRYCLHPGVDSDDGGIAR